MALHDSPNRDVSVPESAMHYVVTWLKMNQVLAQDEFDDLLAARDHLFSHRPDYEAQGATGGRVSDDHTTYFQVEWASGS